jgi:glycosyl hydrolase family 10
MNLMRNGEMQQGNQFVTRRQFLKRSAAVATGIVCGSAVLGADGDAKKSPDQRLSFGTPLTHCDWMLKDNRPGVTWGIEGVRHMLSVCKAAGMAQVYWRLLDAGRAMYKSRLVLPAEHYEFDQFYNPVTAEEKALLDSFHMDYQRRGHSNRSISEMINALDYSGFDSFAAAVQVGHELGLEIHAWVTINEDDHGWGAPAAFSRLWPEYKWVRRDGRPYRSQLSLAFPKVMEYKLGIIKEALAYDLDGLFIDWLRTGDVRDNPQTDENGVANYGYELPSVEGFKGKYGVDPHTIPNDDARWVRFRAEARTEFMRRVRKLARAQKKSLPISVLVANPWCYRGLGDKIAGNLNGLLVDIGAWAHEGLIDAASPAAYFKGGGSMEEAYRALKSETSGRIEIWPYEWAPKNPNEFATQAARARSLGAKQILFWEGDYFDDPEASAREAIAAAMSAQAAASRRSQRY